VKQQTTKHLFTGIIVFIAALVLVGCGAASTPAPTSTPESKTNVSVQLSWTHNIEYAGFYMAQNKGFYDQENLAVELRVGGYDNAGNFINPIDLVASGKADFGIFDGGEIVKARANGVPVVAIASNYQRHPMALVSMADKNITRPQDLIGKRVQVADNNLLIYNALLASQGIAPSQVNMTIRTDFTIAPLTSGDTDVLNSWVTNDVVRLEAENYKINMIVASDYGIDMYPDVIFTSQDMVTNHPDLVLGFLRATLRGVQGSVDDPDTTAHLSSALNPDYTFDTEKASMARSLPLLNPPGSHVGMMAASVWQFTEQTLRDQGILTTPLDVNTVYTMTFLNQIYPQ
jgi:ABC-type nitrate/sulfonate/bicarbonate transport system substrate-binding protein